MKRTRGSLHLLAMMAEFFPQSRGLCSSSFWYSTRITAKLSMSVPGSTSLPRFIILNEQTLPVQPFSYIYRSLQPVPDSLKLSDFCPGLGGSYPSGPEHSCRRISRVHAGGSLPAGIKGLNSIASWINITAGDKNISIPTHSRRFILSSEDAGLLVRLWRPLQKIPFDFLYGTRSWSSDGSPSIRRVAAAAGWLGASGTGHRGNSQRPAGCWPRSQHFSVLTACIDCLHVHYDQ